MIGPSAWEKVRCPLCGKEVSRPGLVLHLHQEHGLTLREAREIAGKGG